MTKHGQDNTAEKKLAQKLANDKAWEEMGRLIGLKDPKSTVESDKK